MFGISLVVSHRPEMYLCGVKLLRHELLEDSECKDHNQWEDRGAHKDIASCQFTKHQNPRVSYIPDESAGNSHNSH